MKNFISLLALTLLLSVGALAQTPLYPSRYTVSSGTGAPALPAASTLTNKIVMVIDGTSTGDCTVGGGTAKTLCVSTGSSWVPTGDGTGAGGTLTAVTGAPPINSSGGSTPAISIDNAAADGSTKGAASFTANDFNSSSGNISIDYTNGQSADATHKGFLPSADWVTFNAKQNQDGDLDAIAAIAGTSGLLKKTAANTWSLDTNTYLTGNQTITLSGDVSGSGATAITTTIGAGKVISSMLNITTTTCTNQFITAISATGIGTCTADLLASAQHANQGSTTTVLHGNAAGNPSFGQIVNADITNSTIDLTAKVTGILPSANGGTGVNNAGTITNASNTTITGGGTLTLAGFNLTVPATGTAAMLNQANSFTLINPLTTIAESWIGPSSTTGVYFKAGNVGIGTTNPTGVLEVVRSNAFGAYFTTSTNGNGIALGGNATLGRISTNQTVPMTIEINGTEKARFDASGNFGIGRTSVGYKLDVNGTAGFGGTATFAVDANPLTNYTSNLGSLSNKYLTIHGAELWVETLVAQNTVATIGGRVLVAPTTPLSADLAPAGTTITVKYDNLNNGDRVYLESNGKVEFIAITSVAGGSAGVYTYTVTRDLDGSGANQWYAGDAVLNTGTTGNGFIDLYSVSGVIPGSTIGPTIVGNVRTGTTYNNIEPRWAIGNLNGLYGYSGSEYGAAFGTPTAAWVKIDPTNGVRLGYNTTTNVLIDAAGNASFAAVSVTGDLNVGTGGQIRSGATALNVGNGWWLDYNAGTPRFRVGTVVSGGLTAGMEWDGSTMNIIPTTFVLTATGLVIDSAGIIRSGATALNVGNGWYLDYNSGTPRLRVGTVSGGALVNGLEWDGSNLIVNGGGTFTGALSAATGTFAGSLSAASGTFAGSLTAASGAITGTLTMSGSGSAIAIGTTPPTSASAGTGIWEDRTGIYGLLSNVVQAKFDATTGGITAGAGNVALDVNGIALVTGSGLSNTVAWTSTGVKTGTTAILNIFATYTGSSVKTSGSFIDTSLKSSDTTGVSQLLLRTFDDSLGSGGYFILKSTGSAFSGTEGAGKTRSALYADAGFLGLTVGANASPNAMLDVRGDIFSTGSLGATGSRLVKGWFVDLQVTNAIAGSVTGNAAGLSATLVTASGGTNKTSWTAGSIPYLTSSSAFAEDNANFFWDGSNHRLGVGTASPSLKLHVLSTGYSAIFESSSGGAAIKIKGGGAGEKEWGLGDNIDAAGKFSIRDNTDSKTAILITGSTGAIQFSQYGVGTATFDASGNITSVSDLTVKRDVRPFTRGLDALMGLKPIMYGYTKESKLDQTKDDYVGYGAQNVQEFIPEAVGRNADGKLTLWDRPILDTAVNGILELNRKVTDQQQEIFMLRDAVKSLTQTVSELKGKQQ